MWSVRGRVFFHVDDSSKRLLKDTSVIWAYCIKINFLKIYLNIPKGRAIKPSPVKLKPSIATTFNPIRPFFRFEMWKIGWSCNMIARGWSVVIKCLSLLKGTFFEILKSCYGRRPNHVPELKKSRKMKALIESIQYLYSTMTWFIRFCCFAIPFGFDCIVRISYYKNCSL